MKKEWKTDCFAHSLYWHREKDVLRFTEPNGKVSVAGPEGPDAGRGPGRSLKKLLFGRPEGGGNGDVP